MENIEKSVEENGELDFREAAKEEIEKLNTMYDSGDTNADLGQFDVTKKAIQNALEEEMQQTLDGEEVKPFKQEQKFNDLLKREKNGGFAMSHYFDAKAKAIEQLKEDGQSITNLKMELSAEMHDEIASLEKKIGKVEDATSTSDTPQGFMLRDLRRIKTILETLE